MKSLIAITLGVALAISVFGVPTNQSMASMNQMSPVEHATMMDDCASGACEQAASSCAEHCFVASGFQIDTGMLPLTNFLVVAIALILTILPSATQKLLLFQFQPIAYKDPRLILSTQKRE